MKYLLYISSILVVFSCKKIQIENITKINSGEVLNMNGSYLLQGQIIDLANEEGIKLGHCWSTNEIPTFQNSRVKEANVSKIGSFYSSELEQIEVNQKYYYRAFAIQGSDTLLFEIKSFILTASSVANNNCSLNISNNQVLDNSSVKIETSLNNFNNFKIKEYGVCWSNTSESPSVATSKTIHFNLQLQAFNDTITNLFEATDYSIRSYVKLDDNTIIYSNQITVNISQLIVKTVNYAINGQVATLQGEITQLGVEPITDHGFCWSTVTSNPNYNNEKISLANTNALGYFYSNLQVATNTTYYFRAYAIQNNEIKYGQIISIQL